MTPGVSATKEEHEFTQKVNVEGYIHFTEAVLPNINKGTSFVNLYSVSSILKIRYYLF